MFRGSLLARSRHSPVVRQRDCDETSSYRRHPLHSADAVRESKRHFEMHPLDEESGIADSAKSVKDYIIISLQYPFSFNGATLKTAKRRNSPVKTDKKNSGRTRNTGKSEVITENKYLGTLENVLAKLMDKNKPAEFELERFGLEAAAIEVIERLEIRELLQKHFPASFSVVDTADYLIAAIIHRLHEAEPKSKIEDFINKSILKRHYGLDASKFNSQNYWKAYDSIISEKAIGVKRDKITELKKKELTEETRKQIEKLEIEFGQNKNIDNFQKDFLNVLMNKEKLHSEFLYIDSTNFYNYIENNNGKALLCAKGKSKAGKNFLNQITLSIAATAEYGIPLVNEIYKLKNQLY